MRHLFTSGFASFLAFGSLVVVALGMLVPDRIGVPQDEKKDGKTAVTFDAKLIDAEKKAATKAATIEVTVEGFDVVDPASVMEKPKAGQGHIHYQIDGGVIVATTAKKLSFHNLSAGSHKFVISLAGNDHKAAGHEKTLSVTIP
jgi:hypothetical protein